VQEAYTRHSELPAKLVLLACGINARSCAGAHLRSGHFWPGLKLLAHAFSADPAGTFSAETARLLVAGGLAKLSLREWLNAFRGGAIVGSAYADLHPGVFCRSAQSHHLTKLLEYANSIRTRRPSRLDPALLCG